MAGKRVVVIGSGATAVTLVPALAEQGAEHVTMVQRSPVLRPLRCRRATSSPTGCARWLGDERGHDLTRRKNIWQQRTVYRLVPALPARVRRLIRKVNEQQLPAAIDVDTHFNPAYDPWDQRLCAVPDGDLFTAMRRGQARIVTDRIETFTASGVRLAGGRELEADVIVTATGLNLLVFGGMTLERRRRAGLAARHARLQGR